MARITDTQDLIKLEDSGLTIADYSDIVDFLIYKYKQIYGNDIDTDPRTADGRFIECVGTIMWNGFRTVQEMYNSLDPSVATGKFLDIICSLSNVRRKGATKSVANITIKNVGTNKYTFSSNADMALIDVSGNLWKPKSLTTLTLNSGESADVIYECDVYGKITTSTLKLAILNSNIEITKNAIEIGSEEESDSELRSRRSSFSTQSFTVLEGLQGELLDIDGVEDVIIYNNDTVGDLTTSDSTSIPRASVYIVLRYNKVIVPNDETIGNAIIDYMTPGIYTAKMGASVSNGTQGTYTTTDKQTSQDTANWKIATPVAPNWTFTINLLNNWSEDSIDLICSALNEYLNNARINQKINEVELVNLVNSCDPKTNGTNTFFLYPSGVSNNTELKSRTNLDTYYHYDNMTLIGKPVYSSDNSTITLTFGEKQ